MPIMGVDKSKPKGIAALIVESMAPKHGEPMDEDKTMAGKEFIGAVQSGDPARVVRAFETLFAICEMQPHAEYGEDDHGGY